jgi:hypothetical protein
VVVVFTDYNHNILPADSDSSPFQLNLKTKAPNVRGFFIFGFYFFLKVISLYCSKVQKRGFQNGQQKRAT